MNSTETEILIRHSHQPEDLKFTLPNTAKIMEIADRCQEFYKTDKKDMSLKIKEDFAAKIKFIQKLPIGLGYTGLEDERTIEDYMLHKTLPQMGMFIECEDLNPDINPQTQDWKIIPRSHLNRACDKPIEYV